MKKNIMQMSKYELGEIPAGDLAQIYDQLKVRNATFQSKLDAQRSVIAKRMENSKSIELSDAMSAPFFVGNETDLNKIVWPFMLASEIIEVVAGSVANANINVTQEAGFVVTHITAAIYKKTVVPSSAASAAVYQIYFPSNVRTNDIFRIMGNEYVFGVDFVIGATVNDTIDNLVTFINANVDLNDDILAARPSSGIMTITTLGTGVGIENDYHPEFERVDGDVNLPRVNLVTAGADAVTGYTSVDIVDLDCGCDIPEIDKLRYNIVDSQSKRSFHEQPVNFSHLGGSRRPLILDAPYLIMQNQNWEVRYTNDGSTDYIPQITLHGYRLRIDDMRDMLSLANA